MTGHWETAQDVAQEAFARLAAQEAPLRGPDAERRWLFVVARNLAFTHLRSRKRDTAAANSSGAVATPEQIESGSETAALIAKAIHALPDDFREVVVLREYESMSYAEIADIIGAAVGTVKSRLARARSILREQLAKLLEIES